MSVDRRYTAVYASAVVGASVGEYMALRSRSVGGEKPDGTITAHCRWLVGDPYTLRWCLALGGVTVGATAVIGHVFLGRPW